MSTFALPGVSIPTPVSLEGLANDVNKALQQIGQSIAQLQGSFSSSKTVRSRDSVTNAGFFITGDNIAVTSNLAVATLTLTGAMQFGTFTNTVNAITGYIAIKDAGGTTRHLAVVA